MLSGLVAPGDGGAILDRTAIVLAQVPKRASLAVVESVIGLYNGLVAAEGTPKGVQIPSGSV